MSQTSPRRAAVRAAAAVAACVSAPVLAVGAAGAAQAADGVLAAQPGHALAPQQAHSLEQSAAQQRVPFALPLNGVVQHVTGQPSTAAVQGSVPAALAAPDDSAANQAAGAPAAGPDRPTTQLPADGQLLPDPLVPPLHSADETPQLDASAPLPSTQGSLTDGAMRLGVPASAVHGLGAGLGLGHPISLPTGGGAAGTATRALPEAGPAQASGLPQIAPDQLAPSVQSPQLNSTPSGSLTLDQRASDTDLLHPLQGAIGTVNQALHGAGA